ncbi:hypothetical protein BJV82DRAFT_716980 [Fennellomyces sp. T-0311]|nr:hypothetical protein BJV82DRAFT_716980 [Fennellomyces sp. T-0311]
MLQKSAWDFRCHSLSHTNLSSLVGPSCFSFCCHLWQFIMTRNTRLPSLPLEIQNSILSNLSFHECRRLNGVCKAWRSMGFDWSGRWTTLSTSDKHKVIPDLYPYRAYISGNSVRGIRLEARDEEHVEQVFDFLVSQKCNDICLVDVSVPFILQNQFFGLANLCGDTLTDITIAQWDDEKEDIVTPDKLIVHCPSLTKLCYSGPLFQEHEWGPVLRGYKNKNLVDLTLDIHDAYGDFDAGPFLEAVPNLRGFCLNFESVEYSGSDLPSTIYYYCPKLVNLVLVNGEDFRKSPVKSSKKTKKSPKPNLQHYPGLNYLMLGELRGHSSVRRSIIYQLTSMLCNQLERLDLSGRNVIDEEGITHLSSLTFSSLKYLILHDRPRRRARSALCSFLMQSAPNLVHLTLHKLGFANDAILTALVAGAKSLQELALDSCASITSSGLVEFIKAIHLEGRSLKKIVLRSMLAVSPELLVAIAKFQPFTLEELMIHECSTISIDDFKASLRKHTPYRGIRKLDINFTFRTSKQFPPKSDILKILKRMDSQLMEWKFALVSRSSSPYFKVYPHPYREIDHIDFRKPKQFAHRK